MTEVAVDDLAFATGEAIAWPVTARLGATTPLLRRLEAAGGASLAEQLRVQEPLPVGAAIVTAAGSLRVQWLVSAVVASDSEGITQSGVRRAFTSALQRATDWRIEHLFVAPFGLGAGNLELETSVEIMSDVIAQHAARARHPLHLTIVVESALEQDAFLAGVARSAS